MRSPSLDIDGLLENGRKKRHVLRAQSTGFRPYLYATREYGKSDLCTRC